MHVQCLFCKIKHGGLCHRWLFQATFADVLTLSMTDVYNLQQIWLTIGMACELVK